MLSVFNGEKYLAAQLDSIINQTLADFVLYTRDDGSSDSSPEILRHYSDRDARIKLVSSHSGHLGLTPSLKVLLQQVREPVIFFADQDDEWMPHKMETMTLQVRLLQPAKPWVIFSDLLVTDSSLNVIHDSFWDLARINPDQTSFSQVVRRNPVTGCASAINAKMLETALRMPDEAIHDWWMATMAALEGMLLPVREPLVLYRQHNKNTIGAHRGGILRAGPLLGSSMARKTYLRQLDNSLKHLEALNRSKTVVADIQLCQEIRWEIRRRKRCRNMLSFFS